MSVVLAVVAHERLQYDLRIVRLLVLHVSGFFIYFVVLVVDSVERFHAIQDGHIDI